MKYLKPFNESKKNEDFQEIDFTQWNKLIYGEDFHHHYYQYNNLFLQTFANEYKANVMKNWQEISNYEQEYLDYKIIKREIEIEADDGNILHFPFYKYKTSYQRKLHTSHDIIFNWELTIIKTSDDWFAVKLILPTSTFIDLEKTTGSISFGELGELVSSFIRQGRRLAAIYYKCDQIYGLRCLIDWLYEQIKISGI